LSGGPDGPVGRLLQQGNRAKAEALMARFAAIWPGRLYVELQRHPGEGGALPEAEARTERGHVEMAYAMDLPLVATNDVYFPKAEMFEAHDALICIAEGAYVDQQEPRRRLTPQHYFKSPAEMAALFADLPEAVANTVEIARRCAFKVAKRAPILPRFAEDEVEELRRQAGEGLRARLAVIPHAAPVAEYEARLDFELGIIEQMGFPGYFLIVADFIKWAKGQGIPVGPGRGSGAGSLVAYALTITDLDPLRYSLLFERFLNPERVSMPDFDIDFCMDRREEVITYVQERYGREKVAQIITFGALLSKAAVRDVGRVLQMPYGQVDRLSKMIPMEGVKPVSIEKALADEPRLREARARGGGGRPPPQVRDADRGASAQRLDPRGGRGDRGPAARRAGAALPRPEGRHAGHPVQHEMGRGGGAREVRLPRAEDTDGYPERGRPDPGAGAAPACGRRRADALCSPVEHVLDDIGAIPLDDEATYRLYASAKTVAVFQVESSGMMDALRRMKPTCIEDIVALVALYRPGPMENIPTYCEVKNGLRPLESIHPSIDHILQETQGIIVYQEQVMEIAQVMAGYTLGGADLLRRAMGKKIAEEMAKERPKFIAGAIANGVTKEKAGEVFDLLEKFANYGFNKSHAAAYAVVSYQTAWLKANHPVEFMAGVMNCDIHLTDKLATYADEVRRTLGIEIVPPCVNRSAATFTVGDGKIVYALGALKNVGVDAMRLVVEARGQRPFVNLHDFARRVDMKRIGKRPLEMLARAGGFDQLDPNRRRVMAALDALFAYSAAIHEQRSSTQVSLFGEAGDDLPEPRLPQMDDWLPNERLAEEHAGIGFYLSGHPLDDYMPPLKRSGVKSLAEVTAEAERAPLVAKMAGSVAGRQERKSARGNRFAFVQMSDPTGLYEVTVFSETLEVARDLLEPGQNVVLTVQANMEADQLKLLCTGVAPVDAGLARAGRSEIRVFIEEAAAALSVKMLLERYRDDATVRGRGAVTLSTLGVELDVGGTRAPATSTSLWATAGR
jgi:DNA polymerase III subunit alpha